MPQKEKSYWWKNSSGKWIYHKPGTPPAKGAVETSTSKPTSGGGLERQYKSKGVKTQSRFGTKARAPVGAVSKPTGQSESGRMASVEGEAASRMKPGVRKAGRDVPSSMEKKSKRRKGVKYADKFSSSKTYESAKGKLYRNKEGEVIGKYNVMHKKGELRKPYETQEGEGKVKVGKASSAGQGASKPPGSKPAGSYGPAGGRPSTGATEPPKTLPAAEAESRNREARKGKAYTAAARGLSKRRRGLRP